MMRSVTKFILSLSLIVIMIIPLVAIAQQTMVPIPIQTNGMSYQLENSTTCNPLRDRVIEPISSGTKKIAKFSPSVLNDTTLIGLMANTYATLGENRNQISYDPTTNSVAIIFRGNDRVTSQSVGNNLYVRFSSDGGTTWSAQGSNIASGVSKSPRYPQVCLYNPTKSTNISDVKTSVLWPQVVPYSGIADTWGEVDAMQSNFGGANTLFSKFPTPPNWGIPMRIIPNYTTKKLYTFSDAIDQSSGQTSNEIYLFTSSDGGNKWASVDLNTPAWTSLLVETGSSPSTIMPDVSPDGTHLVLAYMNLEVISTSSGNAIPWISENHRIAYIESTDGGATWSSAPTYIRLADLPSLPSPLDINPKVGWDLDVAYDANNKLHFLVAVSTDLNPFSPVDEAPKGFVALDAVDSSYICEVTQKSGDWIVNKIAKLHGVVVRRRSFSLAGLNGEQYQTFWSEPHFARSIDGYKLYAKWIDPDSSWKFPYIINNPAYPFVADTIHNLVVTGRDIRTNVYGGGWVNAQRITSNKDVGTKYSKMAYYAGNQGQLQIMFTEWGFGEHPDDDPVNVDCKVKYVKDVKVDAPVSVNDKTDPMPTSYTLEQNYPNPFNPTTSISFAVPTNGKVKIRVFDLLGKEIATIANGYFEAGEHRISFDASKIPSGIYIYRMESGSFISTKKMTVLK